MDTKTSSKSWFCVWNNPQETYADIEDDPKAIAQRALDAWIGDHSTRTGAVAYCISADGLEHLHMVLEDSNKARFSAVKKAYPKAHIEPTRGNKQQAEDYIHKRGRFEEKGEQIIHIAQFGEIKGKQGSHKHLEEIEEFLDKGMTPDQILSLNFGYYRYEGMIRKAFFKRRRDATPFVRDVTVYWHAGGTGSGKTYTVQSLIEKYGREEIFIVTDYESGGFDNYCGQKVLFLEEYRGNFKYGMFLNLIDKYLFEFHARYSNIVGLWSEVHITSPMGPDEVYKRMVQDSHLQDPIGQLLRRIHTIVYHWKTGEEYKTYEMPATDYKDMDDLREKATGEEFIEASDEDMEVFAQMGLDL